MRIACSDCHRQYDVRHLEVGAHVRCTCGQLLEVRQVEARDAPMLRCSSCGAQLEEHATSCGFCGSELTFGKKGWGESCPECFARLVAGAKFCSSCGTEMRSEAVLQPLHDTECPRCQGRLAVRESAKAPITECTACGGIWLPEEIFERAASTADAAALVQAISGKSAAATSDARQPVRYLKCPICGEFMHRKNYARISGVIIDWCRGHGYWFDPGEIESILEFVQQGGLERAREREHLVRKSELKHEQMKIPSLPRGGGGHLRHTDVHFDLIETLGGLLGRLFR